MLDDLVSVIETLQQRIRDYGASLRENETRTRMALIDPLLRALGWEVADPALVTPEYNVSGRWADYALLRPDGQPAATIEAKKLGESLASHRMQMLNYSNASGVEYAGLTDGDHWELYEVFQRGQLEDRRILDVSIANTPAYQCALQLLLLWRPNLASGQLMAANAPILDGGLENGPKPRLTVTELLAPPTPAESSGWIALSEYSPPAGADCPSAIRFWDGSERNLGYWNEMLTHTVEKLYSEGLLTMDTVPIQSSNRTYIVNTEPMHPTGNQFGNYRAVAGAPLFVNVNLNAGQVRQNTRRLLQRYGQNPDDVYVQVGQ